MNRRNFLTLLGTSAAAQALPWPKELVYEPDKLYDLRSDVTLERITREIAERVERQISGTTVLPLPRVGSLSWFNHLGAPVTPTDRRSVNATLWAETPVSTERYIDPIASALARDIKDRRFTHFATLALPESCQGAVVTTPRFALRGVAQMDPIEDRFLVRFDYLAGRAA